MTVKKAKAAKSDKPLKKRSQTASSSSSLSIDDKKVSEVIGGDLVQQVSTEDITPITDAIDDTSLVEPMTDSIVLSDEPTLSEIIIEKYEGEKANGRFEGHGRAQFVNGNIFEGVFSDGTMHGKGKFCWASDRTIYEGDFYYNEITGRGKYTWPDGSSYVGDVLQGIRHGNGLYTHPSGKSYSGSWIGGRRHGAGLMNYDTKGESLYEGEWSNNVIQGMGFRQYKSGNTYEGEWFLGKRHGHGTMKWLDRNEQYTGQWKNGIQNGTGQHIWFVQRIKSSQYSLRNIYEGDFVNGKRHGFGVFIYPSGARYEGEWVDNVKCGQGAFIFKNGRIYEGDFKDDRIKEFPNISVSGRDSPDIRMEKTQQSMQDDVDNISARISVCSLNTISPSFQLYFDHLLVDPQITSPDEEMTQIQKAVIAQLGPIRKIYQFYSCLGDRGSSIDNTAVMNQMQFWRFLKDCRLHFDGGPTLAKIDRVIAASINSNSAENIHNPSARIILLSFINYLVTIAHFIFSSTYNYADVSGSLLASCFNDLMEKNILVYSCNVGGVFYSQIRKTDQILAYFNQLHSVYKEVCIERKEYPHDSSMRLRDFLILMKQLNLINKSLTAAEVVRILSLDDPNVTDGQFVCLENEITFYEFYEAMIQCATVFVTKDVINEYIDHKASSVNITVRSDNNDESETERTLTVSRPITGESNKQDLLDPEDKSYTRSKPQSGKTKISSADSSNIKNKKQENEKAASKKPHKSSKGPKTTNSRSRKTSIDRDPNFRKPSILPSEYDDKMSSVPEVVVNHQEYSNQASNEPKIDVTEEIPEFNEEQEFNYWANQIHVFFSKIFFPAAGKYINITKRIEVKELAMKAQTDSQEELKDFSVESLPNEDNAADGEESMVLPEMPESVPVL